MQLDDSPEEAAFRSELRAWLRLAVREMPDEEPVDMVERLPYWREWQTRLHEAGYAGLGWPKEFGGQGAGVRMRAILMEELDRAGAPDRLNTIGEDFIGPTIADFGTPEQKATYLPPILQGRDIWCQLFSEPEAGSDLASLRTSAQRTEGGWSINGQKVWTSRAHISNFGFLLARTSAGGRKHDGLTCFIVPMDAEGVSVRPLRHMLGEAEFNEVFLDDVFLTDAMVVGQIGDGWRTALATLAYERVGIAIGRVNTQRAVAEVIDDLRRMSEGQPSDPSPDADVRQRAADLYGRALIHHLLGQRAIGLEEGDGPPGPFASIGKLYLSPLVSEIADFRLSLEPLGGLTGLGDPGSVSTKWLRLANQSRGSAIAGGTTFIQRNILAERMLGMPRS